MKNIIGWILYPFLMLAALIIFLPVYIWWRNHEMKILVRRIFGSLT
jgi:hypothetical protein